MQSDTGKVVATVFMWIMIGAIGITAMINVRPGGIEGWTTLPLVAVLMFGGAAGMMALWRRMPWESSSEAVAVAREQSEKNKRRGRVERLMDGLSDQEREELLTRLTEADGEVSLDEVLRRR
jgi:hypothetical protein